MNYYELIIYRHESMIDKRKLRYSITRSMTRIVSSDHPRLRRLKVDCQVASLGLPALEGDAPMQALSSPVSTSNSWASLGTR